ncbi:neural cell adhesion molecule L1-like protein, partial [Stegodyphus dumicola]|uniref:neural cell adhesion molecule L1-like protein n=1 Tax=Stegodyphus dumicola TaxID=202533 RepID=UPI0015A901CD
MFIKHISCTSISYNICTLTCSAISTMCIIRKIASFLSWIVLGTFPIGLCTADSPKIKKFNFEDNIKEGDVASVMCLATSAVKPVKFQWEKNGQPISDYAKTARIEDGTSHSVLVFDSVQFSDYGNYTCIASNAAGSDRFTAQLHVKAPPKWEEEPKSIITKVGDAININCIASGSPEPKISWRKVS